MGASYYLLSLLLLITLPLSTFIAAPSPAQSPLPSSPTKSPPRHPPSVPPKPSQSPPPSPPVAAPPLQTPPPPVEASRPPQQLRNVIDALIGAGDFGNWVNIISGANPLILPLSATIFIPEDDAASRLLTADPFVFLYHVVPQRLTFSNLQLFKINARLLLSSPENLSSSPATTSPLSPSMELRSLSPISTPLPLSPSTASEPSLTIPFTATA